MGLGQLISSLFSGQPQMAGQPALDPQMPPQGDGLPGGLPVPAGGLGTAMGDQQTQPKVTGLGSYLKALLPTLQRFGTGLAMGGGTIPGAFGAMRQMGLDQQGAQDNQLERQYRMMQIEDARRKASEPRVMQTGDQIISLDPKTGMPTVVYDAPDKPPPPPAALQLLAAMGIDPKSPQGVQMLERSMTGYGYSPEGIDAQATIADRRAAAVASHRAPPRGHAGGSAKPPSGFILD